MQLLNTWGFVQRLHTQKNGIPIKQPDFTSLTWMFINNTHQQSLPDGISTLGSTLLAQFLFTKTTKPVTVSAIYPTVKNS